MRDIPGIMGLARELKAGKDAGSERKMIRWEWRCNLRIEKG